MNDARLNDIITSKKDCYFISPHYDDMAYSASSIAKKLSKTNRIIVINVFTRATKPPYTRIGKYWTQKCGYDDAEKLFIDRNYEDKAALKGIADEVIDLDFTDAAWRYKPNYPIEFASKISPELSNIRTSFKYRIYKQLGAISKADPRTFDLLVERLKKFIDSEDVEIFCPLGVGGHFDHLITRYACESLFPNPIYWEDYPYNLKNSTNGVKNMQRIELDVDTKAKQKIIAAYKTQYSAMFGDKGPHIIPERLYYHTETRP